MEVTDTITHTVPLEGPPATPQPERILSLDVLRGFDMFWITGGEGIIQTLAAATGWQFLRVLSTQFEHAKWEGFRFYDLIFPLFLFLMGATIPYSLISRMEKGVPRRWLHKKVLTRFVVLFVLGLIYNQAWVTDWVHPCIGSVLGEIAFGYLFASLIALHTPKVRSIIAWFGVIMAVNAMVQFLVPVPGYGAGVFSPLGSVHTYIDRLVMPRNSFFYYMTPDGTRYDRPQVIPPGAVPLYGVQGIMDWFSATIIALLGVVAGHILRNTKLSPYRKVSIFMFTGLGCLLSGLILRPWYPIIKLLQTDTFYLYAGGLCFILLAVFYLLIDAWKIQKWGFFFKVIGVNSITVYMGFRLINIDHTSRILVGGLAKYMGAYGPVLISVVTAGLVWITLYMLYRKKILLKL